MSSPFSSIPEVIEDIRDGKLIILVDDEDRENEGDFVFAADKVTPELVNFLVKHGRGLVCLTLTEQIRERLKLPMMVGYNRSRYETAFTVSIEAAEGVTTGISAQDRAKTIATAIAEGSTAEDIATPGHVFPICAREGGVLVRTGHTEGSVDLARMAGLTPAGVICEIMNEDGTMARLPELLEIAKQHDLKVASINDIIAYRQRQECLVEEVATTNLPVKKYGEFKVHVYESQIDNLQHIAFVKGDLDKDTPTLVRVHSECMTGDIFGSLRCDCGDQLDAALAKISEQGGVLLYMRQEGRGIGLVNKIKAYELQEQGYDTVEANKKLGFSADHREYGTGSQILSMLGVGKMRLLSNNPRKFHGIQGFGLEIVGREPIEIQACEENAKYLQTKRDKLGHLLKMEDWTKEASTS